MNASFFAALRRTRSGFTLIELLVVIAIIAILAAILFPVFAQAREKARAITCISNEKQMGLGVLQYAQDFDETYPLCQYYSEATYGSGGNRTAGDLIQWSTAIYPYMKNGDTQQTALGNTVSYGQGGIYHCPSFPSDQSGEYGISGLICPDAAYGADNPPIVTTLAMIDAPSDKALVVEKGQNSQPYGNPNFETREWAWTNYEGPNAQGIPTNPSPAHYDLKYDYDMPVTNTNPTGYPYPTVMPRYRHQGSCNVLFADGHAKAVQKGQLDWYKNIYVQGAGSANSNPFY